MTETARLDWRHWLLLVLFAVAALAPGITTIPPTDRDESRYAVASTQMLTSGDFVDIRFLDEPRYLQPAGIYWLQSAAVALTSSPDAHAIGAHRLPSLLGALAAVLMTGWLAASLFGRNAGIAAALLLAVSISVGFEARTAKTDAMLLASVTLAQIAALQVYLGRADRWRWPAAFWAALGVGMMIKGPIILVFCGTTILALVLWDRRAGWLRGLRPAWGLPLMLAIAAPWYVAIGVVSDGAFYAKAVGQSMLDKVGHSQQSHVGWPGYHLTMLTAMFWPGSLFAAFAVPMVWRRRAEPAVRFLVAWIVPSWIVYELVATKLPHYVLPTYPAIACLAAAALFGARAAVPIWAKVLGGVYAALWIAASAVVAALAPAAIWELDHEASPAAIVLGAATFALAAAALWLRVAGRGSPALACAALAGLAAAGNIFGSALPGLDSFWMSPRIVEAARSVQPCPATTLVASAYREPSLVFLQGPDRTVLADTPAQAADLLAERGECALALIDGTETEPFFAEARAKGLDLEAAATVEGQNYSDGDDYRLTLYAAEPAGEGR